MYNTYTFAGNRPHTYPLGSNAMLNLSTGRSTVQWCVRNGGAIFTVGIMGAVDGGGVKGLSVDE